MIPTQRHGSLVGITLLSLLVSGCASFVTSKSAKRDNTGIEYTLCLPALVAKPQPDGRINFETTCLPDPEKRYVISGWSFLGNLTLNVKRKKDMTLEEVTIDPNNATVAAETIKSASEIEQKKLEVKAQAEKKKAEEEKAALDEAKKAVVDAKTAQNSAATLLEQAESTLGLENYKLRSLLVLYGLGDREPDAIIADSGIDLEKRQTVRNAYLVVKEKEAARDAAKIALTKADKALEDAITKHTQLASIGNVFNATSGNVPPAGTPAQVWGPLIYRLEQNLDEQGELKDVRLVAMFDQPRLETIKVKEPPKPTPKVTATVSKIFANVDGSYELTIAFSDKVDNVDASSTFLQNTETFVRVTPDSVEPTGDKMGVLLKVPADIASGKYRVVVEVKIGADTQEVRNAIITLAEKGST